jgi:short-subunit dehydrogenase
LTISLSSNATVITGASDGIGKEFASQLAKKKFNVLLVSRTESKLQALAEELGTVTRYCVANKVDNTSTNFFL